MAKFPALPLWTDSYLADTSHLTDSEHGIYLQLLIMIWRNSGCRVPNDNEWLARRFRKSIQEVEENVRPLIDEFCKNDGNWITQGRLKDEWDYVDKRSKSQSIKAKSRWNKDKVVSRGNAQSGNAPTPTPTPIKKIYKKEMFDVFWKAYPRKVSKPKAEELYKKIINNETATHEQIIKGLNNYLADLKTKDWLNPAHPTTWLNAGRWEDVYDDKIIREDKARDLRISSNPQGTGESLAVQQLRAMTCNR